MSGKPKMSELQKPSCGLGFLQGLAAGRASVPCREELSGAGPGSDSKFSTFPPVTSAGELGTEDAERQVLSVADSERGQCSSHRKRVRGTNYISPWRKNRPAW